MSVSANEVARSVDGAGGQSILPHVAYRFAVADADAGWTVRRVDFQEGISELYECVVELATEDLDALIEDVDGASCALWMDRPPLTRKVCGVAARVEWLGTMIDRLVVRVHLRPALTALGLNRDSRIFQQRSTREILQQVLTEGLRPYGRSVKFALDREYRPREYC